MQATGTLATVCALYGLPFALTLLLGLVGTGAPSSYDVTGAPDRAPVHWMPAPALTLAEQPSEDADAQPIDEADAVADAGDPEALEAAEPEATPHPIMAKAKNPRKKRRVRRRGMQNVVRQAHLRNKRAPRPPPTKKEVRKKEKRAKKRERRAERKQCAELTDQILVVSETEVMFGREIVNCFRTHLEQFDGLGGAEWADVDGKRIGIELFPSRRSQVAKLADIRRGDIIKSVNGFRMRSWTGVGLAATQIVRGKAKIKRIRNGETQVVRYDVVSLDELEAKREELAGLADAEPPSER